MESEKLYSNLFFVVGTIAIVIGLIIPVFDNKTSALVGTIICIAIGLCTLLWGFLIRKGRV